MTGKTLVVLSKTIATSGILGIVLIIIGLIAGDGTIGKIGIVLVCPLLSVLVFMSLLAIILRMSRSRH